MDNSHCSHVSVEAELEKSTHAQYQPYQLHFHGNICYSDGVHITHEQTRQKYC